jgi:hypothetical protein
MLPRRFTDLSAFGRGIIATVAILTLAITAVAFAASYNALYHLFDRLGLYGEWVTLAIPLLLDAAFIGAELAAILAGILRAVTGSREVHRGWPVATLLVCGALTIVLNVVHAYFIADDPLRVWRCLAASLPPVLMMLAFQLDIAIVRWVMVALGRPLSGDVPGSFLVDPRVAPQMQNPRWPSSELGQGGQWGSGAGGGVAANKKGHIVAELERLGPEEVLALGPDGIAAELRDRGVVDTSPRYVRKVMDEHAAGRNGKGHP